jgi:transposase
MNSDKTINVGGKIGLIKIAIDMHLRSYRVVRQFDHSAPQPAQKFEPEAFYRWLGKQQRLGERVVVCYEAGCFGYVPARRMQAMGVEVLVIAPQSWDEQGKRQVNDKLDALVMCRRLSDHLDGHKKALSVVYIPTPEQEALRAQARMREQLRRQIRRMQAMGRSLLLLQGIAVRGRWWAPPRWRDLCGKLEPWVREHLAIWKHLIEQVEPHAVKLETRLRDAADQDRLVRGQGELTQQLLERELINPQRFGNTREVGNYFGLCPSESTTGDDRRLGAITKRGNPRLRKLIIEAAWRVVAYQPGYIGARKFLPVLSNPKAGGGARKKAIVAVARHLAVDLWRIAMKRCSAEQLGLILKEPSLRSSALLEHEQAPSVS